MWKPVSVASDGVLAGRWLVVVPDGLGADEGLDALVAGLAARGAVPVLVTGVDRAGLSEAAGGEPVAGVLAWAYSAEFVLLVMRALAEVELSARVWALTRGGCVSAARTRRRIRYRRRCGVWVGWRRWSCLSGGVVWWICPGWWTGGRWIGWWGWWPRLVVWVRIRWRCVPRGSSGVVWCVRWLILVVGVVAAGDGADHRWYGCVGCAGGAVGGGAGCCTDAGQSSRGCRAGRGGAGGGAGRAGCRVGVAACDVADRAALAALLAEHPADAVVHAAGVVDYASSSLEPTGSVSTSVLEAKVAGAVHLDEFIRARG